MEDVSVCCIECSTKAKVLEEQIAPLCKEHAEVASAREICKVKLSWCLGGDDMARVIRWRHLL